MSGRMIVIEGLDGVGKTTLSKGLAAAMGATWLTTPSEELRAFREPFDRAYQDDPECSQLFYAASVLAVGREAERRRMVGDVIVDRYWSSTCAYAASRGSRLELGEVERLLPAADLTIVVELDEEERWRRLCNRGYSRMDVWSMGETGRRIGRGLRVEGRWAGVVRRLAVDGLDADQAVQRALWWVETLGSPRLFSRAA